MVQATPLERRNAILQAVSYGLALAAVVMCCAAVAQVTFHLVKVYYLVVLSLGSKTTTFKCVVMTSDIILG